MHNVDNVRRQRNELQHACNTGVDTMGYTVGFRPICWKRNHDEGLYLKL